MVRTAKVMSTIDEATVPISASPAGSSRMPNAVPAPRTVRHEAWMDIPGPSGLQGRGSAPRATSTSSKIRGGKRPAMGVSALKGIPVGGSSARGIAVGASSTAGTSIRRPTSEPTPGPSSPVIRTITDGNSSANGLNKTAPTLTYPKKNNRFPNQQAAIDIIAKRRRTTSMVDSGNKISNISARLSLNSAVSITSKSPLKVDSGNKISNISARLSLNSAVSITSKSPLKIIDSVDLTKEPDKLKKFWPCEKCPKTYLCSESLYAHICDSHKIDSRPFKCDMCSSRFISAEILNNHKTELHQTKENSKIPYVVPILDFQNSDTLSMLRSMGITNYVPVAQLGSQIGQYGIPIINISHPVALNGLEYKHFFDVGCVRKL